MLKWAQWREKSKSSLEAAQILLERNMPVEAASRAYYAAYQMTTAVLIKLNLSPRDAFGNWSHEETVNMYHTHVCRKVDLGFKEKTALKSLFPIFRT
ncbi:MAG: HEPN domain-containing protein, partial [bacterium]